MRKLRNLVILAGLVTAPLNAQTGFDYIEFGAYGGWDSIGSVAVSGDGTLRIWDQSKGETKHQTCSAKLSIEWLNKLRKSVSKIPPESWGKKSSYDAKCADGMNATLIVVSTAGRTEVTRPLFKICTSDDVPSWTTSLTEEMAAIRNHHAADCRASK